MTAWMAPGWSRSMRGRPSMESPWRTPRSHRPRTLSTPTQRIRRRTTIRDETAPAFLSAAPDRAQPPHLRAADDRSRFPVEAVLHEASIQTRGAEPADGDPADAVRCGEVRHCHSGQHHRAWRDRRQASAAWRMVVDLKTSNPGNHFNIMPARFGLSCISLPKSGHVSEPPDIRPDCRCEAARQFRHSPQKREWRSRRRFFASVMMTR